MTSWGKDRLDIEVFGTNSSLFHKCWANGAWGAFENLAGVFIYSPAAVVFKEDNLHLFGIGSDSALWHKYWESGWKPPANEWTSLGGVCMTPPVVAKYGKFDCAVFVIGTDRACWVNMITNNSNASWVSLGGKFVGDSLTAVSYGDGRLDVFGVGIDGNHLLHKYYDGGNWSSSWEDLGGVCIGKPKAVSARPRRIDIFTKGTDSAMYQLCFNGKWQDWQKLGGVHIYEPDAVCWDANRIDVFSVSTDTQLTHICADISKNDVGSFVGNWEKVGGTCTGSPRVVSRAPNLLDVFVKGRGQQVLQKSWNGSAWVPAGAALSDLGGVAISNTT